MKKKIVILASSSNRLANQLWNFMSIYAYCLERTYECQNPSFFRYHRFFSFPKRRSMASLLFSFLNALPWQRARGFSYSFHEKYITWIREHKKQRVIADKREPYVFYLPPSEMTMPEYKEALSQIEKSASNIFYFDGWLFRNPVGIEKYRKEITAYFAPRKDIREKIENFILELQKKYSAIIGVHIRQDDYKTFKGGKYFFTQEEVRKILDEYLQFSGKDRAQTAFVICSDGPIDRNAFAGLNIVFPQGNAMEDLFTLAKTEVIIGSNSTYGAFASYYGNIPFIIFEHSGIEWDYYRDKKGYFENKKSTFVFY